jgi:hypothetical protein
MKDCRYFTNYLESYTPAVLKCITLSSELISGHWLISIIKVKRFPILKPFRSLKSLLRWILNNKKRKYWNKWKFFYQSLFDVLIISETTDKNLVTNCENEGFNIKTTNDEQCSSIWCSKASTEHAHYWCTLMKIRFSKVKSKYNWDENFI